MNSMVEVGELRIHIQAIISYHKSWIDRHAGQKEWHEFCLEIMEKRLKELNG